MVPSLAEVGCPTASLGASPLLAFNVVSVVHLLSASSLSCLAPRQLGCTMPGAACLTLPWGRQRSVVPSLTISRGTALGLSGVDCGQAWESCPAQQAFPSSSRLGLRGGYRTAFPLRATRSTTAVVETSTKSVKLVETGTPKKAARIVKAKVVGSAASKPPTIKKPLKKAAKKSASKPSAKKSEKEDGKWETPKRRRIVTKAKADSHGKDEPVEGGKVSVPKIGSKSKAKTAAPKTVTRTKKAAVISAKSTNVDMDSELKNAAVPAGAPIRKFDELQISIDGAARGNPGLASFGVCVLDDKGQKVQSVARQIGKATSNVAEWNGLLEGMRIALSLGAKRVCMKSDSMLVVNQIEGTWRVKQPHLIPLHQDAMTMAKKFDSFSVKWIPREENHVADSLANHALDSGDANWEH